ncbi:MAG: BatA domain-containing protein, partial [Candidatus Cloacimonetes bacterium]|nr:BatA domain-containing protein [Candidatus Cloacimonadota bacterium]
MFQLSFLNASLLFFAAATILPLLIWLLAKKKPLRVLFPTLRFIKQSKEQEKSRSKLKNILLLIIRMLIILLVALAVARPMFSSAKLKPSSKHPPTAIVIMLDTSYSMDYAESGKSSLQYAKDAIKKINLRANSDDRLILISSNENWNQLHAQIYAGKIPESLLENISVTHNPLDLAAMLSLAEAKLQESQMPNREIYLITDNRVEPIKLEASAPIALIPLPESSSYENIACTDARVLPQLVEKRRKQSIQFTIANHGNNERKDVLVKAVIGGIKLAERFVDVPARQTITESITLELQSEGWQTGYIEVLDERLLQDNRSYFAFPFYDKPRLAVVSLSQNLPFILSSLLNVYTGGYTKIITPNELSLGTLDNYQILVLHDSGALSPRLREVLTEAKARKIGVLFLPANNLAADMKAYLNSTFKVDIKERSTKPISIDQLNRHHYVSSIASDKNLKNRIISDYWVANSQGANAIVSAKKNPLLIVEGKQSLWLWNIASLQNPFFVDPAFPVMAFRNFDYLANAEISESQILIGDVLSFNKLRLPNGEISSSRRHKTLEPGIYILEPETPQESAVAINIDYKDSEARLNPPSGAKILGKNWEKQLFFSRLGHDLWR